DEKIGTTGRGIGPAYTDKISRAGVRVVDFIDPDRFRDRLASILPAKNRLLQRVYDHPGVELDELLATYAPVAERLRPYICDTSVLVADALTQGKRVLFEGAQGTMLDIDHGTYPFVTSSSPTAGGVGP